MEAEAGLWWVMHGSAKQGPYTLGTIKALVKSGTVSETDLIWKEGLGEPVLVNTMVESQLTQAGPKIALAAVSVLLVMLLLLVLMATRHGMSKDARDLLLVILLPFVVFGLAFLGRNLQKSGHVKFAAENGFDYVPVPSQAAGYSIVVGSVMAGDQDPQSRRFDLLRGDRGGYRFHAVDTAFGRGRSPNIQTVICIDLKHENPGAFSIIDNDLLEKARAAGKTLMHGAPVPTSKNKIVVVDATHQDVCIPAQFLRIFSQVSDLNVECLKNRLLIYRVGTQLTGEDLLKELDCAVGLAAAVEAV